MSRVVQSLLVSDCHHEGAVGSVPAAMMSPVKRSISRNDIAVLCLVDSECSVNVVTGLVELLYAKIMF